MVSAVTGVLILLATITMVILLDPVLLAVTLAALVLAQVVIGVVVPRISRAAKQAQASVGEMSAALERALGNIRTVKASGAEARERDRAVLVVAHRLSTVTMADRIVVMDTGRVRAIGRHAELVATDPLYGELAATRLLAEHAAGRENRTGS